METHHISPGSDQPLIRLTAAILAGLLVLRVFALLADPNSLYADETQYWLWSRSLDWGYFSKPPMIAWIIASTTAIFGNADWAVRLAAPFLHSITAVMLGLTAARLFDVRVGAFTALGWAKHHPRPDAMFAALGCTAGGDVDGTGLRWAGLG